MSQSVLGQSNPTRHAGIRSPASQGVSRGRTSPFARGQRAGAADEQQADPVPRAQPRRRPRRRQPQRTVLGRDRGAWLRRIAYRGRAARRVRSDHRDRRQRAAAGRDRRAGGRPRRAGPHAAEGGAGRGHPGADHRSVGRRRGRRGHHLRAHAGGRRADARPGGAARRVRLGRQPRTPRPGDHPDVDHIRRHHQRAAHRAAGRARPGGRDQHPRRVQSRENRPGQSGSPAAGDAPGGRRRHPGVHRQGRRGDRPAHRRGVPGQLLGRGRGDQALREHLPRGLARAGQRVRRRVRRAQARPDRGHAGRRHQAVRFPRRVPRPRRGGPLHPLRPALPAVAAGPGRPHVPADRAGHAVDHAPPGHRLRSRYPLRPECAS